MNQKSDRKKGGVLLGTRSNGQQKGVGSQKKAISGNFKRQQRKNR